MPISVCFLSTVREGCDMDPRHTTPASANRAEIADLIEFHCAGQRTLRKPVELGGTAQSSIHRSTSSGSKRSR